MSIIVNIVLLIFGILLIAMSFINYSLSEDRKKLQRVCHRILTQPGIDIEYIPPGARVELYTVLKTTGYKDLKGLL